MKDVSAKLREDKLWQEVYALAEFIYSKIDDLVADFPEEQTTTINKLRYAANDSLFYTSQAIGGDTPEASIYDWSVARKNLFSLQTMYTFGAKQGFFELQPEIIVNIDNMIKEIDRRTALDKKEAEKKNKEELEPWLEKYRIWQKMQD